MSAPRPRIAELSDAERQVLESWLVHFDQDWRDGLLVNAWSRIPADSSWRLPALAEMVKIDLERRWQLGHRVDLEWYLERFPELGHLEDIPADLILAEYEVRRQFGAPAALEDYLRRFPNQASELGAMIASGHSSLSRRASGERPPTAAHPGETPAASPPPPPRRFGRYTIVRPLGQGGMGAVYLAEDTQLARPVALKIPIFTPADGPEARERFFREARTAATLDHPYLCPVYDVGEIDGRLYLTMQYIEGKSLAALLRGQGMPVRQVAALVGKLALALEEAHAKGVVHRDLKPANVMIKVNGTRKEPVIVDFGLARRDAPSDIRVTKSGQVLGTLAYMAPEQIRGVLAEIGPASDIYALGVILYELLTGRLPFVGPGYSVAWMVLSEEPAPPSSLRTDLDPRLEVICLKAMAKRPEDRYASMKALAAALGDVVKAPTLPGPSAEGAAPTRLPSGDAPSTGGAGLVNQLFQGLAAQSPEAPRREEPSPSHSIEDGPKPALASDRHRLRIWLPLAAGVLLFGAVVSWVVVVRIRTPDGTIVVEDLPDDADVTVDGAKITIRRPGDGRPLAIQSVPGKHRIRIATREGAVVYGETVEVASGGESTIRVRLVPPAVAAPKEASPESDEGFVSLFNSMDLDDWRDDLSNGSEWRVEDGVLSGKGALDVGPAWLSTIREDYDDFRLRMKVLKNGGTGWVWLRRSIGDESSTCGYGVTIAPGERAAGTIYKFVDLPYRSESEPAKVAEAVPLPEGDWYTVEITASGNKISASINGTKVAEYEDGESSYDIGPIMLVARHQSTVQWKDIAIKHTPRAYGGERRPNDGDWAVEVDELVQTSLKGATSIPLVTRSVSDFDMSYEFRIEKGDGGVWTLFHAGDPVPRFEYFEVGLSPRTKTKVAYFRGGVFGIQPNMTSDITRQAGRWQQIRLVVRGAQYRCLLDGQEIFWGENGGFTEGGIGLGTTGTVARFRNIVVASPRGKVYWKGIPKLD